jgi:hypothetical protein
MSKSPKKSSRRKANAVSHAHGDQRLGDSRGGSAGVWLGLLQNSIRLTSRLSPFDRGSLLYCCEMVAYKIGLLATEPSDAREAKLCKLMNAEERASLRSGGAR